MSTGGFGDVADFTIPRYDPVSTTDLEDLLSKWVAAEKAITTGQNYSVEGLSVSRADLPAVVDRINQLTRELRDRRTASLGGRVGVMTPKWT